MHGRRPALVFSGSYQAEGFWALRRRAAAAPPPAIASTPPSAASVQGLEAGTAETVAVGPQFTVTVTEPSYEVPGGVAPGSKVSAMDLLAPVVKPDVVMAGIETAPVTGKVGSPVNVTPPDPMYLSFSSAVPLSATLMVASCAGVRVAAISNLA